MGYFGYSARLGLYALKTIYSAVRFVYQRLLGTRPGADSPTNYVYVVTTLFERRDGTHYMTDDSIATSVFFVKEAALEYFQRKSRRMLLQRKKSEDPFETDEPCIETNPEDDMTCIYLGEARDGYWKIMLMERLIANVEYTLEEGENFDDDN